MNSDEYAATVDIINEHVTAILRGRALLRSVREALAENANRPFEQDHVFARHYGRAPSEAQQHLVHGVAITSRILHQTGTNLSDIAGADLLYEVEDSKYVLIQYKRANAGRVTNDPEQMTELIGGCPSRCNSHLLSAFWCGAWVALVVSDADQVILPSCAARDVFAGRKSATVSSFKRAMTHSTFDELFAKCYAGARTAFPSIEEIAGRAFGQRRIVFVVTELA